MPTEIKKRSGKNETADPIAKVQMAIEFFIDGNQDSPYGNPMPKVKLTAGQHWTRRAQKYVRWREHVQCALLAAFKKGQYKDFQLAGFNIAQGLRPIVLAKGQTAMMTLEIEWADETHPDPENVFGSIADALFQNDKHLNGTFHAEHSLEKKGRVKVRIDI